MTSLRISTSWYASMFAFHGFGTSPIAPFGW
jgi:hypothetical protein